MEKMNNYLNVYDDESGNKVFHYEFPSLYALVRYLKTSEVNRAVFGLSPASESNRGPDKILYGEPLEDALEHTINGYHHEYSSLKELCKFDNLVFNIDTEAQRNRTYKSYIGSRVDVPAYVNGSPKNMRRLKRYDERKIIDFYFSLSYGFHITENQIINRGIIAIHLIKSLEEMGYCVNLKAFELDTEFLSQNRSDENRNKKEVFYVVIHLKDFEVPLNESKCVAPFIRKEFLRRIMFRLLEVTPVSKCWGQSYGRPEKEEDIRKRFNLKENDIYFGTPEELGIKGEDLATDYQTVINKFGLSDSMAVTKRLKK